MEKHTAEVLVKIISVLYYIGAAFSIIFGLMFLLGGGAIGVVLSALGGGLLGGLIAVLGVVFLVLGVLDFFVGYGLWKFKSWARIVALVLAVLGLLSFPIGTIFGIFVIYLFGFNTEVKNLFK